MNLFKKRRYWWEEDEEKREPVNRSLREELEYQFQNPIHDKPQTRNPFANLDTSNMNLRQELEAKFKALNDNNKTYPTQITPNLFQTSNNDNVLEDEENGIKRQALEYANKVKQSIPESLDIENGIVMSNSSLSPLQKLGKMTWNNFKNFNSGIRMGEVAGELAASKEEMDEINRLGYDNYAHRYGMYTNAKDGLDKALYTLGGGVLKEIRDIYDKSIKGNKPWGETLCDSYKDTLNNIEAVYAATKNNLKGDDIDGRLWLDDFDYLHNKWRRRRRR